MFKAKENFKIKEAFETLVRKILTKNSRAGSEATNNVSGVFGANSNQE